MPLAGQLVFTGLVLSSSWPVGFATATRMVPLTFNALVHPPYWVPQARSAVGTAVGAEESSRRGTSDRFLGLREYQAGDLRRHVHWPTSARAGVLMVVEREAEADAAGAYELELEPAAASETVDLALSVMASLVAATVNAGAAFTASFGARAATFRRWRDFLDHAATVEAPAGGDAPRRSSHVRVTATAGQVVVEADAGRRTIPASATLEDARAVLEDG